MRLFYLGAIAPAALIVAAPVNARPVRVDVPVEIDPNSSVYILWVKVQADGEHTLVSGYVRQKRWFARRKGDLHILFLRDGQQIACKETQWAKNRYHSHGRWRFTTSADVGVASFDTVRISHVIHDPEIDRSPGHVKACSGLAARTEPNLGGA